MAPVQALPIDDHCAAISDALSSHGRLVLTAAPGAGKSTRVPPALARGGDRRVLVLQPRRAAARQLARRVAQEQGWALGREVGYQTRFDKQGGEATRLWYVTTGILRRRLQDDPTIEGVDCVVLDEFHERSLDCDVILGWLRDLRDSGLRPDIELVVMSATMDAERIARFLGDPPRIDVPGTLHPIRTVFQPALQREWTDAQVLRAMKDHVLPDPPGDVLVFLPGQGEIRSCCQTLAEALPDWRIQALHGSLPTEEQDRVLQDDGSGPPRVICATNIAETSLTVPGVRCVIDAGQQRIDRFDAQTGFPSLDLEGCSRFQADQRRGRAGRLGPGICVRLWSKVDDSRRSDELEPEIRRVELLPLLLDLKSWWGSDARAFPWLDAPEAEAIDEAESDLRALGLVDASGQLTDHGRQVAALPLHPRLANLLVVGAAIDELPLAASCAALIDGRDPLRPERGHGDGDDLGERLRLLAGGGRGDRAAILEAKRVRDDLLRQMRWRGEQEPGPVDTARLLRLFAAAWPDRIGVRSAAGSNRLRLTGNRVLQIDERSQCHLPTGRRDQDLIIALRCIRLRGKSGARNVLSWGLCCDEETMQDLVPGLLVEREELVYDRGRGAVRLRRSRCAGPLVLRVLDEAKPDPATAAAVLATALRPQARQLAEADGRLGPWLQRYRWLRDHGYGGDDWPVDDEAFYAGLLADACIGCSELAAVKKADWLACCQGRFDWSMLQTIDQLAPASVRLPNGREAELDYGAVPGPVLACKMAELFGSSDTPRIAGGRHAVTLHLCAPNGRPQQITDDLAGFWQRTWPQVRKDLRGRYVKHPWPEDPLSHPPCKPNGKPIDGR